MSKVQWRPQLNALTTPRSYKAQPVPKESLCYDEMAALIAAKNPLWSPDLVIKSVLLAEREALKEQLISGNQVSYENTCTWHLSISARLDSADAPLPPDARMLQSLLSRREKNRLEKAEAAYTPHRVLHPFLTLSAFMRRRSDGSSRLLTAILTVIPE